MAVFSRSLPCVLFAAAALAQRAQPALAVGEVGAAVEQAIAAVQPAPWGAVLVAKDGKPVFARGYGMLDRGPAAKGKEVTALSLFDIGGAVQELSQALAVRLVDEKRLKLDDPLGKLLKGWPDDKAAMTVDHLLLHTSGMPTDTKWENGANDIARAALVAMAATPLAAKPGERFVYSDLNATLLALVLEARGGAAYDKLLEQKILAPFGMATTVPCSSRGADGRLVTWRFDQGAAKGEPATAQNCNWRNRGVRNVLASVHDVHAFLGRLCDGKTFDAGERDLLLRPLASGSLRRDQAVLGGRAFARVAGYVTGYCTQWTLDAAARDWIVVMTSDDAAANRLTAAVVAVLGPAAVASPPTTAPTAPPVPAQRSDPASLPSLPRFVGEFDLPAGGRFAIESLGQSLRLFGCGAEASVRVQVGAWDRAAASAIVAHEDRATALVQRLFAGEVAALDEAFGEHGDGAAEATSAQVAEFQAAHGPLVRCRFLGDAPGQDERISWLRLEGRSGAQDWAVRWRDARQFRTCTPVGGAVPPFFVDLAVVAPDRAVGRTANGNAIVCTIEGKGTDRVLVFEDATPGSAGLLECRLSPQLPR